MMRPVLVCSLQISHSTWMEDL
uniref:Uncharacterized protein n=1 Tax=Arundo donax TaxID=35708 RepID=A0A0A9F1J0_ARUDO